MVKFQHTQCPLQRYTFSVRPIRIWVENGCDGLILNLFTLKTKLAINKIRNDLDPEAMAQPQLRPVKSAIPLFFLHPQKRLRPVNEKEVQELTPKSIQHVK